MGFSADGFGFQSEFRALFIGPMDTLEKHHPNVRATVQKEPCLMPRQLRLYCFSDPIMHTVYRLHDGGTPKSSLEPWGIHKPRHAS